MISLTCNVFNCQNTVCQRDRNVQPVKNVTRDPHNVIRFLGFIWILFGVSFFSRIYAKLDFSLSILYFLEVRVWSLFFKWVIEAKIKKLIWRSPFGDYPFRDSPLGGSPFRGSPFGGSPFGGSPFGGSPFGVMLLHALLLEGLLLELRFYILSFWRFTF